jgi:hypothetical protein
MPNHVINVVAFKGVDAATQEKILALACNEKGDLDFEVLLPVPLNYWRGQVGSKEKESFGGNALEWCSMNWGTKWGPYGEPQIVRTENTLTLTFRTAWNTPRGWLCALFNKSRVPFHWSWLAEGGWPAQTETFSMGGTFGDRWTHVDADESTAKNLHVLLWGSESFE